MFSRFLATYNYTAKQALDEYAKTFFALAGQIYKDEAINLQNYVGVVNAGMNGGKQASEYLSKLKKQAEGNDALIREAKTLKGVQR